MCCTGYCKYERPSDGHCTEMDDPPCLREDPHFDRVEIDNKGYELVVIKPVRSCICFQGEGSVPELWRILDDGGQPLLDGSYSPIYFHSEEAARVYVDHYGTKARHTNVCEVPEAARRWMMMGIRVW